MSTPRDDARDGLTLIMIGTGGVAMGLYIIACAVAGAVVSLFRKSTEDLN
jgi:hypothetical protein